MIVVFEAFLAPGADPDTILSEELIKSTKAQVMTPGEARAVGFAGLPDRPGEEVRLIAVAKVDAKWIQRVLETSEAVGRYQVHEVD